MAGFTVTAWDEIQAFYEDLIDNHGFTSAIPMLKLVRSVIAEGGGPHARGAHIHARSSGDDRAGVC